MTDTQTPTYDNTPILMIVVFMLALMIGVLLGDFAERYTARAQKEDSDWKLAQLGYGYYSIDKDGTATFHLGAPPAKQGAGRSPPAVLETY